MLVRHPESVAVVAVEGENLVVVRQARAGAPEPTLELPSGKVEEGETYREAAARELAEECGLSAAGLREIGCYWAVPAYSTERVHLFEATGLVSSEPVPADPDEALTVERVPLADALGTLSDAVSIAGLALWRDAR